MTNRPTNSPDAADLHAEVRRYYAAAARAAGPTTAEPPATDDLTGRGGDAAAGDGGEVDDDRWGAARYDADTLADAGDRAVELSMGCGNPYALADLQPGETVLDLGSGGGLDVILSARRVGPTGKAYGLDFLDEMLELGRSNAAEAGVDNVEFLPGMIEAIPLGDDSVDVVISNCVINLAPDKRPVFTEIARVLRPGGRVAVSDVVADDGYRPPADGEEWAECGAGALPRGEYLGLLAEVGLIDASITYTHDTGPGLHAAAVRARRPA